MNIRDSTDIEDLLRMTSGFSLEAFMADLLRLVYVVDIDREALKKGFGNTVVERLDKDGGADRIIAILAEATDERRAFLDGIRSQLEMNLSTLSQPLSLGGKDVGIITSPKISDLAALGVLSLSLAVQIAFQAEVPEIALGFLDSVEALSFAFSFTRTDPDVIETDLSTRFTELLRGLPSEPYQLFPFMKISGKLPVGLPWPEHYLICADLARSIHESQVSEWKRFYNKVGDVLREADFVWGEKRLDSLTLAAGLESEE